MHAKDSALFFAHKQKRGSYFQSFYYNEKAINIILTFPRASRLDTEMHSTYKEYLS